MQYAIPTTHCRQLSCVFSGGHYMVWKKACFAWCAAASSLVSYASAAELLDVKPVVAGSAVEIQVTTDIPMTYTYYKVPGQARAVIDIADADPEKVEPLIVVNKGAVSSISVDKAQISGMVVSRIVFNLVAESDILVQASADRKQLSVTFDKGGAAAAAPQKQPEPAPVAVTPAPAAPEPAPVEVAQSAKAAPAAAAPSAAKEEDPLGLDEPASGKSASASAETAKAAPAVPAAETHAAPKLEPVVPTAPQPVVPVAVVSGIIVGANFIDIQSNHRLEKHKVLKLAKPMRLAIDIPAATSSMTSKSIAVNRLGISKIRVGVQQGGIRIVMDAAKKTLPAYSITTSDKGMRIHLK